MKHCVICPFRRAIFRRAINPLKKNCGMALLVTLALVSVLTAAALEVARRAGDAAALSRKTNDRIVAEEMALSGIEFAKMILTRDAEQSDTDSVQELWADSEKMAMAPLLLGFEPDNGSLEIVISDELGKIQINSLIREFPGHERNEDQAALWERFLNLIISSDKSIDLREPAEIINSIKDWLDTNDDDAVSGLSGAESSWYESLDPPVLCPNAPMNRIDELFMVKGVPEDFIHSKDNWGEADNSELGSSELGSSKHGSSKRGSSEYADMPLKLSSLFTVYGMDRTGNREGRYSYPGRININTADAAVLAALLPSGMEDQVSELIDFRTQKGERSEFFVNSLDKEWYKQVIDLSEKEKKAFDRLIRYDSYLFRVDATAQFNGTEIALTTVLRREKNRDGKWGCITLQLAGNGLTGLKQYE